MSKIQVLDPITIDKIAAGEVIERPAAVVKELVENGIDAGATSITIEIKDGGIPFIRITDNGGGIKKEDISNAFLRHATSKIRSIDDLSLVQSLGFRGEALSSIASVAQVELHTKCQDDLAGSSYIIHGGTPQSLEESGVKNGTTFIVKQLFYNIPARRKFLKTPSTEASHIGELVTRLALSHPQVSFQFINNDSLKLHTSGNGSLKDMIYGIYGREIANNLLEVHVQEEAFKITGFIGKPVISRGNRNYENYFINGRYVKSQVISKAIEDGYKGYAMQHHYPFTVLHLEIDTQTIDVNVHPTKMELRFTDQNQVYQRVYKAVQKALSSPAILPQTTLKDPVNRLNTGVLKSEESVVKTELKPKEETSNLLKHQTELVNQIKETAPTEGFTPKNIISKPHKNTNRYGSSLTETQNEENLQYFKNKMEERVLSYHNGMSSAEVQDKSQVFKKDSQEIQNKMKTALEESKKTEALLDSCEPISEDKPMKQLNMFEEHMIEPKITQQYRLIGNVFSTYWMIEYKEELYIIDQHAAHEKVLYETTMKNFESKEFTVQYISPPIVLTLSMQEKELLENNLEKFTTIGFELETFGNDSYAIRGVPANLFTIAKKELFMEMLDELSNQIQYNMPAERILEKIASMSCKAAVKGKSNISTLEVETLISQLLELENPFHCPHGRPTIISISKKEMEKKFKRII